MKRFYKVVGCDLSGTVTLDGKPVRTPGGHTLKLPTAALAEAVAAEWAAVEGDIKPDDMPLTQLAVTVIDRVSVERPAMRESALAYLDTDLLCYRAPLDSPVSPRQTAAWDRWVAWFTQIHGPALKTTTGLSALRQDDAAHTAAAREVDKLDNWAFGIFQAVVAETGSLVLALAFTAGVAGADDVLSAMFVEEDYKAELYDAARHGHAPQEEKARTAAARDLKAAAQFLKLLND